ncbi:MAG: helix-turn-helix transcriptional regulator [Treponema sp.]|nr:helix-turn-helix transcriptional regulator [Treponema sp.]
MNTQQIFITNLKTFRKQKGYTQAQLAGLIDKSFNYINGIECGVSFPPPDVIDQIASVLNVKTYQLFDENGCEENIINSNKDEFIKIVSERVYQKLKEDLRIYIEQSIRSVIK